MRLKSTEKLDQIKYSPLAAPAGIWEPTVSDQFDPVTPLKSHDQWDELTYFPNFRRSTRVSRESDRYDNLGQVMVATKTTRDDPQSDREEIGRSDHKDWCETIEKEMRTIQQKVVWSLVAFPVDMNVTATRQVYQVY